MVAGGVKNGAIFVIAVLMLGMLWQLTLQRAWDQGYAAHKPDAPVLAVCVSGPEAKK